MTETSGPLFDSIRMQREWETVNEMILLYCRGNHHPAEGELCPECASLCEYARARLTVCPYGVKKPVCAKCPIHCYNPEMRARMRAVMRFSGPRLLLHKPVLVIRHLIESLHKAPARPLKHKSRKE